MILGTVSSHGWLLWAEALNPKIVLMENAWLIVGNFSHHFSLLAKRTPRSWIHSARGRTCLIGLGCHRSANGH